MQKYILFFLFIFIGDRTLQAQEIYTRTFGKKKNPAVIYLHGGPGYNCVNFEVTTAQKLADEGFYVIVYDRRGEGRSTDAKAKFTFEETFADLNQLYKDLNIKKAMLMGHSFGGVVAVKYATQFPTKVSSIVLVGAPVSLQETFRTIQQRCKLIYESKQDTINLKYLNMLTVMDSTSLPYSSYSFMHAMQNGFYTPKKISNEAKSLYGLFRTDTTLMKYAAQMTFEGPKGFWEHEQYTMLNLREGIHNLLARNMKIYGLYGKEDGLYSIAQIENLAQILGEKNLLYFDDCSHNVFIDQQNEFLKAMKNWGE